MKGTILKCIEELVTSKFGEPAWDRVLDASSFPKGGLIMSITDIPDAQILSVIGAIQAELGISQLQVFDAFADHWVGVYCPRVYSNFYDGVTSSREFLSGLDKLHERIEVAIPGAMPPRFRYEWRTERELTLYYDSERGLIELMVAMVRALGRYYDDDMTRVAQLDDKRLEVVFAR